MVTMTFRCETKCQNPANAMAKVGACALMTDEGRMEGRERSIATDEKRSTGCTALEVPQLQKCNYDSQMNSRTLSRTVWKCQRQRQSRPSCSSRTNEMAVVIPKTHMLPTCIRKMPQTTSTRTKQLILGGKPR
jgi:hypothetical protein